MAAFPKSKMTFQDRKPFSAMLAYSFMQCSIFSKFTGPNKILPDMSSKIWFGPVNSEKISHCMNRQAWLKRAFGPGKPFWIWESLIRLTCSINFCFIHSVFFQFIWIQNFRWRTIQVFEWRFWHNIITWFSGGKSKCCITCWLVNMACKIRFD